MIQYGRSTSSLCDLFQSDSDVPDSFDIYSSDGVSSFVDETQNESVRLLTHLDIEAEHENDNNENYRRPSLPQ
jgi:hypothetical protein